MDPQTALDTGRETLMLTLMICLPLLLVGLVVGVTISLIQAVTQVQEMTLTFVPKVVAVVLAGIFLLPYFMDKLLNFATTMFSPMVVP